jgi:hypothetical protein
MQIAKGKFGEVVHRFVVSGIELKVLAVNLG